jgi:hypothetical protein
MSDEFYRTPEARLDTIMGDDKTFWLQIKDAKKDYDKTGGSKESFFPWLLDNYGIQVNFEGMLINTKRDVVDEQKYLIFLLKYGGNT